MKDSSLKVLDQNRLRFAVTVRVAHPGRFCYARLVGAEAAGENLWRKRMPHEQPFVYPNSDCGPLTCVLQGPRGKAYKCPCCENEVIYEWHYVLLPEDKSFRRHAHKRCIELYKQSNLQIKLIPARRY